MTSHHAPHAHAPHAHGPTHLRRTIARAKARRAAAAEPPPGPGARLADAVAATVGSWRFIIVQSALLGAWIVTNAALGGGANAALGGGWDPYPFILLNLVLSFQAAYAAPIIMMSQNRQSDIDRARAVADHAVNLRAEADITLLHEKIDLLREKQLVELAGLLARMMERMERLEARRA